MYYHTNATNSRRNGELEPRKPTGLCFDNRHNLASTSVQHGGPVLFSLVCGYNTSIPNERLKSH